MQSNSLPPPVTPRPLDVYTRVAFFTQLPDYQGYLAGFAKLPAPADGGCGLLWNYATPAGAVYDQAVPSYLAQVMQSLTPLGSEGSRRAAPTRPKEASKAPVSGPPATRPRQKLPAVLDPADNPEAASQSLAVRLVGDAKRRAALTVWQPVPEENQDALRYERLALYFVLARDNSLRYNVDSGRFARVYSDGEARDVLSMAWVGQVLRQGQPDRWNRVEQRVRHLALDQHLFTPPPPPPPKPPPRPRPAAAAPGATTPAAGSAPAGSGPKGSVPAGSVPPGSVPPGSVPPGSVPPGSVPAGSVPAGSVPAGPVPAGSVPAGSVPAGSVPAGSVPAGAVPAGSVPAGSVPVPAGASPPEQAPSPLAPVPTADLTLKVHRYWDIAAGGYSEVSSVQLEGDAGQDESIVNSERKPWLALTRSLPMGSNWRITVTWANGVTRCWEQHMSHPRGVESEVFSPDG